MTTAPIASMTYAEYLAFEAKAETKHEFLDGHVYAMAGGTPEHAALAAAVARLLGNAIDGKPCRVYSSDLRVMIEATGMSAYPDIVVVCGKLETSARDTDAVQNPVLLVEILSDSTEGYDRGAKASHYRKIPSLKEYMLVSQHEPLIEIQRKNERGGWELLEARAGDRAELTSVGVSLDVDAVYRNPLAV